MSQNNELKWLTKRRFVRYIPTRYQALVASITAALVYFNLFQILFTRQVNGDGGTCGSFIRPLLHEKRGFGYGWFWNAVDDVFSDFSTPEKYEGIQTHCSHIWGTIWWQFLGSFVVLAICGVVLRRAIKRDSADASAT